MIANREIPIGTEKIIAIETTKRMASFMA